MTTFFYFHILCLSRCVQLALANSVITLYPTTNPGGDDAININNALTTLEGYGYGAINLIGNFTIKSTIKIPSNIHWTLNGSLKLSDDLDIGNLDYIGYSDGEVSTSRQTGITEKAIGTTNISMTGGLYLGNYYANAVEKIRFINFIHVRDSQFNNMEIQDASDDNFSLGQNCSNNTVRFVKSNFAGGNGLTDKGHNNFWYDSEASNCLSDGWTPKCSNSEFHRCKAVNNTGPGVGCYARKDGSPTASPIGEKIVGNKFYEFESYDNLRGISFNIADRSGSGAEIRDNFIQGVFSYNKHSGIRFRCKLPESVGTKFQDNFVDLITFGNKAILDDNSGPYNKGGGLSVDGGSNSETGESYIIKNITGFVIAYENPDSCFDYDIDVSDALNSNITAYTPSDRNTANIDLGSEADGNVVSERNFNCSNDPPTMPWLRKKYCPPEFSGPSSIFQCPRCGNEICNYGEVCKDNFGGTTTQCGNGICEDGEDCQNCPIDCLSRLKGPRENRYCCEGGPIQDVKVNNVGCDRSECESNGISCSQALVLPEYYCCLDDGITDICDVHPNATDCNADCSVQTSAPVPPVQTSQPPSAPPTPECGLKGTPCSSNNDCCRRCQTKRGESECS